MSAEAGQLFEAYLELGSVKALTQWAERQGIRTKIRRRPDGSIRSGGLPFSRGNLHALLRYRTYVGEVEHKGNIYPGEQDAIIPRDHWDQVQEKLQRSREQTREATSRASSLPLTGLIYDETGDRLTPTHATKAGRRYGYYVSRRLVEDDARDPSGWRLPAATLERAVVDCIAPFLADRRAVLDATDHVLKANDRPSHMMNQILNRTQQLAEKIQQSNLSAALTLLRRMLDRIEIGHSFLRVRMRLDDLVDGRDDSSKGPSPQTKSPVLHTIERPCELKRRGVEMHLIIEGQAKAESNVDVPLIRTIAQARTWFERLQSDPTISIKSIADHERIPASEVSRRLPLAFLSPKIVTAILRGEQPSELTATTLLRQPDLPMDWRMQEAVLLSGTR